jgi:hypothetical protein
MLKLSVGFVPSVRPHNVWYICFCSFFWMKHVPFVCANAMKIPLAFAQSLLEMPVWHNLTCPNCALYEALIFRASPTAPVN